MVRNKKIYTYFRWLLSPIILIVVLRMVDVHGLSALLASLKPSFLCMGLIVSFLVRLIMVYRWALLLRAQGVRISQLRLLKIMLASNTIGILIPSSLGGDGIRAYALWKHTGNGMDSVTSIAADRFAGVFALTGIAFFSGLLSFQILSTWKFVITSAVLFGLSLLLTIAIFWQNARIAGLCNRLKSSHHSKLAVKALDIVQSLLYLGQNKRTVANVIGLSVVAQLLRILMHFYLALALGIDISFIYFCMVLPIIMLLLMLPISIGGIGVREATFVYFFAPLGMSIEQAVGLSLLCYMVVIWWLLIGWTIYTKEGIGAKKGAVAPKDTNFVS